MTRQTFRAVVLNGCIFALAAFWVGLAKVIFG